MMQSKLSASDPKENFTRVSRAILDILVDILRNDLRSFISPANINNIVRGQKKIDQNTIRDAARRNNYDGFDITLLYTILR